MSSAAGIALLVIEALILSCVCFQSIRYFQSSLVQIDVSVTVFVAWVFGLTGTLLLPYDLALAVNGESVSSSLKDMWLFSYWLTFFMAWVLLPLQKRHSTFVLRLQRS